MYNRAIEQTFERENEYSVSLCMRVCVRVLLRSAYGDLYQFHRSDLRSDTQGTNMLLVVMSQPSEVRLRLPRLPGSILLRNGLIG